MSLLERLFYFHQQIVAQAYPNSQSIAREFEVSTVTAKRDISYLRDRLLAPLVFDPGRNGYRYQEPGFQLPFADSPRLVLLLAILGRLAEETGLGGLKEVGQLRQRLSTLIAPGYGKIVEALYCQRIETEAVEQKIFETILTAFAKNRLLSLRYQGTNGATSHRHVVPLRLINYQGHWYLLAFCILRQANRLFHLARVLEAEVTNDSPAAGQQYDKEISDSSFGIFLGKPRYRAKILFTATAATIVARQLWHRDQTMEEVAEGLILRLPVGDDREIVMKILQYGAMARVLEPPELVERVTEEVRHMAALYSGAAPRQTGAGRCWQEAEKARSATQKV